MPFREKGIDKIMFYVKMVIVINRSARYALKPNLGKAKITPRDGRGKHDEKQEVNFYRLQSRTYSA